jgi:hypothetical protein
MDIFSKEWTIVVHRDSFYYFFYGRFILTNAPSVMHVDSFLFFPYEQC